MSVNADAVVDLLKSKGGYALTTQPLRILDVDFTGDFDAVLEGPSGERSLVIVLDAGALSPKKIRQRIEAVCVALSRSGSMRPITIILNAGNVTGEQALAGMQSLCRTIVIPQAGNPSQYLRSLLRLELPPIEREGASVDTVLQEELGAEMKDQFVESLLRAARKSALDVEQIVREHIDRAAKAGLTVKANK